LNQTPKKHRRYYKKGGEMAEQSETHSLQDDLVAAVDTILHRTCHSGLAMSPVSAWS
jgi:hypothetical protein